MSQVTNGSSPLVDTFAIVDDQVNCPMTVTDLAVENMVIISTVYSPSH